MASVDLSAYLKVDPNIDLNSDIVGNKIADLVGNVPEKYRYQIDRCLSMAFESNLEFYMQSEANKKGANNFYFTEDPQGINFHFLMFQKYSHIVTYGGNIGGLLRDSGMSEEERISVKDDIVTKANSIFSYQEMMRPIPSASRYDLVEFTNHIKSISFSNFQGPLN